MCLVDVIRVPNFESNKSLERISQELSAAAGGKAADELFHAIRDRQFGRTRCFLCGRRLNKKNLTREHVIPLWAQKRFSLFDQKLTLLNGTTIRYRDLTIPCCLKCNTKHLKPLEDKVAKASLKGSSAVASLCELTLFLWLGKIFYGLLYKELLLVGDRSSGNKKTIIDKKLLKRDKNGRRRMPDVPRFPSEQDYQRSQQEQPGSSSEQQQVDNVLKRRCKRNQNFLEAMWNVNERFERKAIDSLAALGPGVGSTRGVVERVSTRLKK